MAETVGTLNVEIKGRADALDRTLRTTERNTIASGARMEKSLTQALSFGKLVAGIKAVTSATEIAFAGFEYITARINGNLGKAYESANNFAAKLKSVPLFGDLVKLGQFVGSGFVDDDAEAAKIQRETEATEKRQQQLLKNTEDAQKRIRDLTRETALLGAGDDEARKRIQAQFALDDATSGIAGLAPDAQEQIRKLAEQRFRLETRAQQTETDRPAMAEQIDPTRIAFGVGANLSGIGKTEDQPTKKQAETQIGVLRDMLNAITRLKNGQAVAN